MEDTYYKFIDVTLPEAAKFLWKDHTDSPVTVITKEGLQYTGNTIERFNGHIYTLTNDFDEDRHEITHVLMPVRL